MRGRRNSHGTVSTRTRSTGTGRGYRPSGSSRAHACSRRARRSSAKDLAGGVGEHHDGAAVLGLLKLVVEEVRLRQPLDGEHLARLHARMLDGPGPRQRVPERPVELAFEVALAEVERARRLAARRRRQQLDHGVDAVDVLEGVERQLEPLALERAQPVRGRLALLDRAAPAPPTEDVHERAVRRDDAARALDRHPPDGNVLDLRRLLDHVHDRVTVRELVLAPDVAGDLARVLACVAGRLPRRPGSRLLFGGSLREHYERGRCYAEHDAEGEIRKNEATTVRTALPRTARMLDERGLERARALRS